MKVRMKVRMTVTGAQPGRAEQVSWNRGTLINTSCTTDKRRAAQGKIFVFYLQDNLKTGFRMNSEFFPKSGHFLYVLS